MRVAKLPDVDMAQVMGQNPMRGHPKGRKTRVVPKRKRHMGRRSRR